MNVLVGNSIGNLSVKTVFLKMQSLAGEVSKSNTLSKSTNFWSSVSDFCISVSGSYHSIAHVTNLSQPNYAVSFFEKKYATTIEYTLKKMVAWSRKPSLVFLFTDVEFSLGNYQ